MLIKSTAIQRLLRENPMLKDRRFGLPYVGARLDKEEFNPTVKDIADAIDFYGYEVRDEHDGAYTTAYGLTNLSIKDENHPHNVYPCDTMSDKYKKWQTEELAKICAEA